MSRIAPDARVIAWDFDGVLNNNLRDGRFIWADDFEKVTGQSLGVFKEHVFLSDFEKVITGQEDIRDRVAKWAEAVGYAPGPDVLLTHWFSRDFYPDSYIMDLVEDCRAGKVWQVMATNNEWRRVELISHHPDFFPYLDEIFASGHLGVCKPNASFFQAICQKLGTAPGQMMLVDDLAANVEAARALGWQAYHLTEVSRDGLREALFKFCEDAR